MVFLFACFVLLVVVIVVTRACSHPLTMSPPQFLAQGVQSVVKERVEVLSGRVKGHAQDVIPVSMISGSIIHEHHDFIVVQRMAI